MTETSDSDEVYTRQQRIAQLARRMPGKALTSLNQYLDLTWLREAYRRTRKDGAAGVDGQTAADYERTSREISGPFWNAPSRARTERRRCVGSIFPKAPEAKHGPSVSRRCRTRYSSAPW